MSSGYRVQRWTRRSAGAIGFFAACAALLGAGPWIFSSSVIDHLTTLFVYILLAITWNALAGYGGLVSVGQQAFFGLGAYAVIRLSAAGVPVYPALIAGGVFAALVALLFSTFMLELRDGEFAIGMWVLATLTQLLVMLDPIVQGATGTSLFALENTDPGQRRTAVYLIALAVLITIGGALYALLRSRLGAALQAIRDEEQAARSIGIRVQHAKYVVFVFAGLGAGLAGSIWLANSISFQPNTFFGVQWTAYMIFMTLVGGIGTFEGPILGAVIFFAIEAAFGSAGVWYLVGLGAVAIGFALFAPAGIWGAVENRFAPGLLPVGRRLEFDQEP